MVGVIWITHRLEVNVYPLFREAKEGPLKIVALSVLDSIVVSIRDCHSRDPGSIPGREAFSSFFVLQKLNSVG